MSKDNYFKITKANMLENMLDEMQSAMENSYDVILNPLWSALFGLDRNDFLEDKNKNIFIQDVNGEAKSMNIHEIDDHLCEVAWQVIKDVERSISNNNGSLILLNEES